ncbi:hypothetical protein [Streptomyces sp. NBC_00199]|uniref:hypothetical protein n=1 Tax=Streptomyces sp. NBC_00199 TaxID=2975678 RepID=UPI002253D286|nr:hypothetical protein [Streptomyces sp. NBC_00199]MCX5268078.1 hypothetical protein [Streptomyces sp. NBC_00199]
MWTVISLGSARRALLSAAMAGSLLFGATGCGDDGDDDGLPKDYKVVAGTQLCGGKAMSAEASRALKVITGSSRFEASAKKYAVAQAAKDMVEAFPPTVMEDACRIYTPLHTPEFELRITWRLGSSAPTDEPADPKFTVLKMGEKALAAADQAYVYFACRSDKFSPTAAAHIVIGVEHRDPWKEPEDNIKALKDAYATVAHSFSLAMAKELRCEKNGGLLERPVLDPA